MFALNDTRTLRYAVERLGRTVVTETGPDGESRPVGFPYLRDLEEFAEEFSRESMRQIVFRAGQRPFILRRVNYDDGGLFRREEFNPDPDY